MPRQLLKRKAVALCCFFGMLAAAAIPIAIPATAHAVENCVTYTVSVSVHIPFTSYTVTESVDVEVCTG
ncbi:MAG TPA: hypothetical protein VME23_15230 [Terracidiphilus sp.]|nr:hypothetical protein [Terracidiphilus sp.]